VTYLITPSTRLPVFRACDLTTSIPCDSSLATMSCVVSRSVIVECILLLRPRASPQSVSGNDELLCLMHASILFAHTFSNRITARLLRSLYHRVIAHPLHSHHIVEHFLLLRLVRLCTAPALSLTVSVPTSLTSHSHRSHYTPPALPFRSSLSSHTSCSSLPLVALITHLLLFPSARRSHHTPPALPFRSSLSSHTSCSSLLLVALITHLFLVLAAKRPSEPSPLSRGATFDAPVPSWRTPPDSLHRESMHRQAAAPIHYDQYVAPPPFVHGNVIVNIALCCALVSFSSVNATHAADKGGACGWTLAWRLSCPLSTASLRLHARFTFTFVFTNTHDPRYETGAGSPIPALSPDMPVAPRRVAPVTPQPEVQLTEIELQSLSDRARQGINRCVTVYPDTGTQHSLCIQPRRVGRAYSA
jgi:hypothetical protein